MRFAKVNDHNPTIGVCSVAFTRHKFAGERGHLLDAHVGPNEIVVDIAPLFHPCRLHVTSERLGNHSPSG
jgi:hypothetical protein